LINEFAIAVDIMRDDLFFHKEKTYPLKEIGF